LKDVNDVAKKMTKKYQLDGFILSHVELDQTAPAGGNVVFKAVEGQVRKVVLNGNIRGPKSKIEGYVNKIVTGKPAERHLVERYVLMTRALPGLVIKSSKATPVPGNPALYDMVMTFDQNIAGGSLATDNRGSKSTGPVNLNYKQRISNGFGAFEQFDAGFGTVANFSERMGLNAKMTYIFGTEGIKFTIGMDNLSASNPSGPAAQIRAYSEGTTASTTLSYPIILSKLVNWSVDGKFAYKNSASDQKEKLKSRDRLRVGELSTQYSRTDSFRGKNTYDLAVSKGFDMLDASPDTFSTEKSNTLGKATFTKVNVGIKREQQIIKNLDLTVQFKGQFTRDNLFGAEKFSYGGAGIGSGFDGGAISGDRGITGRTDLAWTIKPEKLLYLTKAAPYIFFDGGRIDAIKPARNAKRVDVGFSTGIGSRFTFTKVFSGVVEVSKPIRKVAPATKKMHPRVFGGLTAKFEI
jgi:hemolysin activation/secretion protein